MDVLPDFTTISDDDLKALIERYVHEEEEVSYRRRLLHGKIDILRAELVDRVKRRHAGEQSSLSEVDIERLTEILAHRGPPPDLDEAPAPD
jgi:anti-sigma-K factor RsiG